MHVLKGTYYLPEERDKKVSGVLAMNKQVKVEKRGSTTNCIRI